MLIESLKIYLIRLKTTLHYKVLINNYFLIVVGITLSLLSFSYQIFYVPLIIFLIYLYRNSKLLSKIIFIITISLYIFLKVYDFSYTFNATDAYNGKVYDIEIRDNDQKLIVKKGLNKVIIIVDKDLDIHIGNKIEATGTKVSIDGQRNDSEFDYKEYLKNNRYVGYIKATSVKIISDKKDLNYIKEILNNYINKHYDEKSKNFIKAILLANSDELNEDFLESIKVNGISHLFAVSGLHISLFLELLNKLYNKIKLKISFQFIVNIFFLFFYLLITNFAPSVLRVSLVYFLQSLNKKLNLKLKSIDLQSISFITIIISSPLKMHNLGFILSYIASFSIILTSKWLSRKSNITQILGFSFSTLIFSLPVVININNYINLFTPFINILFITLVSFVILPFTIVAFFLPFLSQVFMYLVTSFEMLSKVCAKYLKILITIGDFNGISILLYYLLIIGVIYVVKTINNKKRKKVVINISGLLILFLLLIVSLNFNFLKKEIYFLDLYNGESTVIINNDQVIVIDTGDGKNHAVSNFLKFKGINKIDGVIITHNHEDHNGELKYMLEEFKITKIYISEYDTSGYENIKKCIKVKKYQIIECGGIAFNILGPSENSLDVNDNSLVLEFTFNGLSYLMMGDASINVEENLNLHHVDVLKIGHHGSKTSTSLTLLEKVHPTYAIIMTGRIKQFGFPNKEVISLLEEKKIKTYRTDLCYQIKISGKEVITKNLAR